MRGLAVALLLAVLGAGLPSNAQVRSERRRVSSPIAFYDDADPASVGVLNVSEYFSYHRLPAGRDISVPSTYVDLGLHRRIGFSAGVGMVRSEFEQSRINAVGDSYIGAKILLVPEGKRRPALAVKPMVEVLGRASIADNPLAPDRVNFVLPLAVQKSFDDYRLYYMLGYVSRGIVFHSLAWELNKWSRVTPTAIVSHSRLTSELDLVSQLGLNRSRSDVTGGAAVALTRNFVVFANTGRSLGKMDLNSTRYQVTAGVSFNVRLWGE